MNITLSDALVSWIEMQPRLEGHDNADQYVESLLRGEQRRIRQDIDQKLVEGLQSGEPIEVNEAFWEERRRILEERMNRHAARTA